MQRATIFHLQHAHTHTHAMREKRQKRHEPEHLTKEAKMPTDACSNMHTTNTQSLLRPIPSHARVRI